MARGHLPMPKACVDYLSEEPTKQEIEGKNPLSNSRALQSSELGRQKQFVAEAVDKRLAGKLSRTWGLNIATIG